jgi:hypothetical protein
VNRKLSHHFHEGKNPLAHIKPYINQGIFKIFCSEKLQNKVFFYMCSNDALEFFSKLYLQSIFSVPKVIAHSPA